jgi:hypothetical protein
VDAGDEHVSPVGGGVSLAIGHRRGIHMLPGVGCSYQLLDVASVELDVGNPRIAQYLEMYGEPISGEQMSLALRSGDGGIVDGSGTTFYSLRESIKTCGSVILPTIVNRTADGRLVVIEGNTRVLIYRELLAQGHPGAWSKIPAMVYDDLPPEQIDAMRLQAHLIGPRAWDPYSKAKYLDHLRNAAHLTVSQIVDFCGGQKKQVLDFIQAYHDMEQHYRPILSSDAEFDPSRFSAFVELQNQRIQKALADHGFTYDDFAHWVQDGRVFPLNTVRQLPRILSSERSREVFLRDGAQEAVKLLDAPTSDAALAEASLSQLARELAKRIAYLPFADVQRLRSQAGSEEVDMLLVARDNLVELCAHILQDQ